MDNRQLAEKFTECIEEVGREKYPNLASEPHGLFRLLMVVLTNEEDRKEAIRRLKERQGQ